MLDWDSPYILYFIMYVLLLLFLLLSPYGSHKQTTIYLFTYLSSSSPPPRPTRCRFENRPLLDS